MENGQEPATKQDIAQLESGQRGLQQQIDALRASLETRFEELRETMRDGQTELLRAFYSFAQSTEAKLKDSEVSDYLLRQRLSAVESRLTEVEKRLNLPPAA